jgi:hypothetical protein
MPISQINWALAIWRLAPESYNPTAFDTMSLRAEFEALLWQARMPGTVQGDSMSAKRFTSQQIRSLLFQDLGLDLGLALERLILCTYGSVAASIRLCFIELDKRVSEA